MPVTLETCTEYRWRIQRGGLETKAIARRLLRLFARGDGAIETYARAEEERWSRLGGAGGSGPSYYLPLCHVLVRACANRDRRALRIMKVAAPVFSRDIAPYELAAGGSVPLLEWWFAGAPLPDPGWGSSLMDPVRGPALLVCKIIGGAGRDGTLLRPVVAFARQLVADRATFVEGLAASCQILVRHGVPAADFEWLRGEAPEAFPRSYAGAREYMRSALTEAINAGNVSAAGWLVSAGTPLGFRRWELALDYYSPHQSLDWLLEMESPLDPVGEIAIVGWVYEFGDVDALEWARQRGFDMQARRRIKLAAEQYANARIPWFWKHWPLVVAKHWRALVRGAVLNDDAEGLLWLRQVGLPWLPIAEMLAMVAPNAFRNSVLRLLMTIQPA